MVYLAAFIFTGLLVGGLVWFICQALETAFDVEGDL